MQRASTLAPAAAACTLVAAAAGAGRAFTVAAPSRALGRGEGQLRGAGSAEGHPEASIADTAQMPLTLGAAALVAVGAAGHRRGVRKIGTSAAKDLLSALAASRAPAGRTASAVRCAAVAVGSKVTWNGQEGTVRFVGATKFASGEWVGLELGTDAGMHNGTVMGVEYFECPPRRGVFAPAAALAGSAATTLTPPAAPAPAQAAGGVASGAGIGVGAKVLWNGKEGVVRYVGSTKFAAGEWVGVEITSGGGMHNGTVMGENYFDCGPGRGVFAQASGLTVVEAAGESEADKDVGEPSPQNQFGFGTGTERLADTKSFLDGIDIFIFDCDGVIWRGDSLIDGIPAVLDKLRAAGKRCFFVTNNSTKSRKGYKAKFDSLGLNVPPEEIFSSSFAAAAYLEQSKFKDSGKKVYVIGEKGIGEELDLIGVPWYGAESDKGKEPYMGSGGKVEKDPNVGAVVVGFDRNINYYKIQFAQLCINENPGCEFIATNTDRVTHLTDAQEWAGNGSMVGAIKGCTGQEPRVVGKPSPLMIDYLEEKYAIPNRKRICMVGDRLDTDILFGRNNGLQTCLTLSGVTSEELLLSPDNAIQPDVYVSSIADFYP